MSTTATSHTTSAPTWGRHFDPTRLARLELRMWKAYYRRQALRLFGLLIQAEHEQAAVSWPSAVLAAIWLTKGAVGFARSSGDYDRFLPDVVRGYRTLGVPASVDVEEVARRELRWWVVRREIGLAAGEAAGEAIARLYSALYDVPVEQVAEAGRLRGLAAEVRDRGATEDPDGPRGPGRAYWPEVARLLDESYVSLAAAIAPGAA
jgi:hypothetical protein